MTINDIELFDLYGNGTLVLKTNVDELRDDLRFTWYVKQNGSLLYKGNYQRNPFTAVQIKHLGRYVVRAFVRDGEGNKVEMTSEFCANKKTSPLLAAAEADENAIQVSPVAVYISSGFWKFSAEGDLLDNMSFAWYIYREGEQDPVFKGSYSEDSNLIYNFTEPGNYYGKLFVRTNERKMSVKTNVFAVEL